MSETRVYGAHWRHLRERKLIQTDSRCERCGFQTFLHLQLHHVNYDRVGAELETDVQLLCRKCHMAEHYDTSRPGRAS